MKSPTMVVRRQSLGARAYQLTDRLHDGRTALVGADGIAITLSASFFITPMHCLVDRKGSGGFDDVLALAD